MSTSDPIRRLASLIPGYGGYREREIRRETDKLVRLRILSGMTQATRCVNDLARNTYADQDKGRELLALLDKLRWQITHLADTIRSLEYGYAPLFSVEKVDDSRLDELIQYDTRMIEESERLRSKASELLSRANGATVGELRQGLFDLQAVVRTLSDQAERRSEIFLK